MKETHWSFSKGKHHFRLVVVETLDCNPTALTILQAPISSTTYSRFKSDNGSMKTSHNKHQVSGKTRHLEKSGCWTHLSVLTLQRVGWHGNRCTQHVSSSEELYLHALWETLFPIIKTHPYSEIWRALPPIRTQVGRQKLPSSHPHYGRHYSR